MRPRALIAAGLAVVASAVGAQSAAAEAPTPQAIDAHAEFLAYAPPPPVPAKICVVDTGVDLTTDAAPAVIERHSVFGGTVDDVGGSGLAKHGTLVAGVIASQADGRDSVGIWPQARIVSVRVFEGPGGGTTVAALVKGLQLCRDRGARVANLSMSGLDSATSDELAWLANRIESLRTGRDVNVVAGAGNNAGAVGYPARFAQVIAVGASDRAGALCPFSNRGAGLDVLALGCGTEVSWPGGGTGTGDGTSYATPVVSGVLAALRAYSPGLSADDAEALLLGRSWLDAAAAFRAAGLGAMVANAEANATLPRDQPAFARPKSATERLSTVGVRPPRRGVADYRGGELTVRIAGCPDFGRVTFRVARRTYRRSAGRLRVWLRRVPATVRVRFEVPGVGNTAWVDVRVRVHRLRIG